MTDPVAMPVAVLVPIKAFHLAKHRLADTLDPAVSASIYSDEAGQTTKPDRAGLVR